MGIFLGVTVHRESFVKLVLAARPFAARRISVTIATVAAAFLSALGAPVTAQDSTHGTGEAWQIVPLTQSSLVVARDGSLIGEIGREWRTNIPLRSLPKNL